MAHGHGHATLILKSHEMNVGKIRTSPSSCMPHAARRTLDQIIPF